jgi:hypothetical protein
VPASPPANRARGRVRILQGMDASFPCRSLLRQPSGAGHERRMGRTLAGASPVVWDRRMGLALRLWWYPCLTWLPGNAVGLRRAASPRVAGDDRPCLAVARPAEVARPGDNGGPPSATPGAAGARVADWPAPGLLACAQDTPPGCRPAPEWSGTVSASGWILVVACCMSCQGYHAA